MVQYKESACQCRRCRRHGFSLWVRKIPCSKKWQPTPVLLPGRSHGQRSLGGCSLWGLKESDTTNGLSAAQYTNKGTYEVMLGNVQSRASLVAQMVKNPPAMQETQAWSLGWEEGTIHGSICNGKGRERQVVREYFIYLKHFFKTLLLAVLDLCCYAWALSSCGEQGLFCSYRAWASVVEHGL